LYSLQAQKFKIKWSDDPKPKGSFTILGADKEHIFVSNRATKGNLLYYRKYNFDAKLVEVKELENNPELDAKVTSQGIYLLNDQINYFIREYKKKERTYTLSSYSTNKNFKTPTEIKVFEELADHSNPFGEFCFSSDNSKVLVYSGMKNKETKEYEMVYKVYDHTLQNLLYSKTMPLPFNPYKLRGYDHKVDNLGNIYIFTIMEKEKDEMEEGSSIYCRKIFVIRKDGEIKGIKFDYKGHTIDSFDAIPVDNNTFICAGFLRSTDTSFFSQRKNDLTSGFFFNVVDYQTGEVKATKNIDLKGLYPGEISKEEDYVPYFIRHIHYRKDGGYVVVAEQHKKLTMNALPYDPRGKYDYNKQYYCDVACINLNSALEVESISRIPKYQMDAANPSLFSTYYNDETYIIYEDVEKNLTVTDDKELKKSSATNLSSRSKNALFVVTVKKDGSTKKEVLYSYKDTEIWPFIGSMFSVDHHKIIMNAKETFGVLEIAK